MKTSEDGISWNAKSFLETEGNHHISVESKWSLKARLSFVQRDMVGSSFSFLLNPQLPKCPEASHPKILLQNHVFLKSLNN